MKEIKAYIRRENADSITWNNEIICNDQDMDKSVEIIAKYDYTGNSDDGIIFISPIEESIKINTKETGAV
ncbi:P-II family nitrogen regulator [Melioribacteraceae bacterium 4301-Me]|uniref:P-II family nitrogen regulator n=1 Tax=Pyranulibacter aquaticus TaxID=3163344 RepID=UPI003598D682